MTWIGEPVREFIREPAPARVEPGPREAPMPRPSRERETEPATPRRREREKVPAGTSGGHALLPGGVPDGPGDSWANDWPVSW